MGGHNRRDAPPGRGTEVGEASLRGGMRARPAILRQAVSVQLRRMRAHEGATIRPARTRMGSRAGPALILPVAMSSAAPWLKLMIWVGGRRAVPETGRLLALSPMEECFPDGTPLGEVDHFGILGMSSAPPSPDDQGDAEVERNIAAAVGTGHV